MNNPTFRNDLLTNASFNEVISRNNLFNFWNKFMNLFGVFFSNRLIK